MSEVATKRIAGRKDDQVFQLSLTEIAFTIIFILLLLLGYLIVKEQAARQAAEAALVEAGGAVRAAEALAGAKTELETALKAGGAKDPEALINKVIDADREREQREALAKKAADLEAELTALRAVKDLLEGTGEAARMQVAEDEVITALTLLKAVRDEMQKEPERTAEPQVSPASAAPAPRAAASSAVAGKAAASAATAAKAPPDARAAADRVRQALKIDAAFREQAKKHLNVKVKPGEEGQVVEQVVQAAKAGASLEGRSADAMQREVSGLRGQVAFLKKRLDANGGRDWPPCWADQNGRVQFLFTVELRSDTVTLAKAWPPEREADARALPGMDALLAAPLPNADFQSRVQGISDWSKRQDPQCRHYVYLRNFIPDAVQSDRARLMVEGYFYKSEARR